jgi:Tol biopolymer transport system component
VDTTRVVFLDVVGSSDPPEAGSLRAGRIVAADTESSARRVIATGTALTVWPGGSQVAFMRYQFAREEGDLVPVRSTLYSVGLDGSNLRQLLSTDWRAGEPLYYSPAWSPDGKNIALAALSADGGDSVRVLDVASGVVRAVPGIPGPYSWSPDGAWLALAVRNGETAEIAVVRVDGSDRRTVVSRSDSEFRNPVWSPDGRTIGLVGCDSAGKHCDIYSVEAAGSDLTRITHTAGADLSIDWGPASLPRVNPARRR